MEFDLLETEAFKNWWTYTNVKESTRNGYKNSLKYFSDFIKRDKNVIIENGELDFNRFYYVSIYNEYFPIDHNYLEKFKRYLKNNTSEAVYHQVLASVRNFFNVLFSLGKIEKNPVLFLKGYYDSPAKDRSLTFEESKKLLKAARLSCSNDHFLCRDQLIIYTLLTCGLRAKEFCMLKWNKIQFDSKLIYIDEGQKTDPGSVGINEGLAKVILQYKEKLLALGEYNPNGFFVLNNKGKPFSYQQLSKLLEKLGKKAGIEEKVTPHMLRYSMARLLYEGGANLLEIQKQLRHKKLTTTLRYINPDVEKRDEIIRKSPIAETIRGLNIFDNHSFFKPVS